MIKVVSFDIGGTLLESKDDNQYSLESLTNLVNKPHDIVKKNYKDIFQKQKGTFDDLVNKFCLAIDYPRNNLIDEFFHHKFNSSEGIIPKEHKELIKKIKNMGYKIILFSNNCCLFKSAIDDELLKYIDKIYYSFDLGYTKNDNESYRIVEQEMNCLPNEFIHIGDTLKSDYLKPIENGWHAIYYGKTDDQNIESIDNLEDIFKYLK